MNGMSAQQVKDEGFIKLYKWLWDDEFKNLSLKAKVLYSFLRDRQRLSLKNGLSDRYGVYQYFTVNNIIDKLDCSKTSAIKSKRELEEAGLIFEIRQGLGEANKIYIRNLSEAQNSTPEVQSSTPEVQSSTPEVQSSTPEVQKRELNKTELNKTELNKTKLNKTTTDLKYAKHLIEWVSQNFGRLLSPVEIDTICYMSDENSEDIVKEAIAIAIKKGKPNLNFVEGILRNWRQDGITTVEQIQNKKNAQHKKTRFGIKGSRY